MYVPAYVTPLIIRRACCEKNKRHRWTYGLRRGREIGEKLVDDEEAECYSSIELEERLQVDWRFPEFRRRSGSRKYSYVCRNILRIYCALLYDAVLEFRWRCNEIPLLR